MRHSFLTKLLLGLTLLTSNQALAREFDVEVIVFKRNVAIDDVGEAWPEQLSAINYQKALPLSTNLDPEETGFLRLDSSEKHLTDTFATLKKHAAFEPLAHLIWRQGDRGRRFSPTIHIKAGQDYQDQFTVDGMPIVNREQPIHIEGEDTAVIIAPQADTPSIPLYELEGTLQVYVQHYLFLEAELDLRMPDTKEVVLGEVLSSNTISLLSDKAGLTQPQSNLTENTLVDEASEGLDHLQSIDKRIDKQQYLKSFRLEQTRRMRSGETHYIDHPLMGILIQVRRAEN